MKMYTFCNNVTATSCRGEHCSSVEKPVRVFDTLKAVAIATALIFMPMN